MRGHRVDAIHAHTENRARSVLPWIIAVAFAIAVLIYALTTMGRTS
jgi:hypothetical protein